MGRLTTETTPEGGTINVYYTASGGSSLCAGNPNAACRATDGRNITTTFTYDALNRVTGKTYSNGDPSVTYSYDQTSCNSLTITNGKGRRTCMSDGSGTTAWSYDVEGHVLTEKRTIGAVTKNTSYMWNTDGSLNRITYPSGRVVLHYYSTAGRLTAMQCANVGCTSINYASGAVYASSGALKELVLGAVSGGFGGTKLRLDYNNRLQPVNMNAKHTNDTVTVMDHTYSFVSGSINDGHVKSVANNLATGRSQTYTYDEMNRLSTAQSQANSPDPNCWGMSYGYDRYANLLSASITKCTGPALSLSVDNTTNKITNTGFQYDAAGNLTNDGFSSYTWNAEGRMASYNSGSVTYTYDGDGRRVKKSSGKLYWYGITGQVLAESDASGNMISEFYYFGGMRIARRDVSSGNHYYFLADRLGNARLITNSTGGVLEESDYYPFGQERVVTGTGALNNYKYTGHERDTESGLDHTLYRQLSSAQGRWLSADPIRAGDCPAKPQGWNRYSYVRNNPTNFIDPYGAKGLPCADCVNDGSWWFGGGGGDTGGGGGDGGGGGGGGGPGDGGTGGDGDPFQDPQEASCTISVAHSGLPRNGQNLVGLFDWAPTQNRLGPYSTVGISGYNAEYQGWFFAVQIQGDLFGDTDPSHWTAQQSVLVWGTVAMQADDGSIWPYVYDNFFPNDGPDIDAVYRGKGHFDWLDAPGFMKYGFGGFVIAADYIFEFTSSLRNGSASCSVNWNLHLTVAGNNWGFRFY